MPVPNRWRALARQSKARADGWRRLLFGLNLAACLVHAVSITTIAILTALSPPASFPLFGPARISYDPASKRFFPTYDPIDRTNTAPLLDGAGAVIVTGPTAALRPAPVATFSLAGAVLAFLALSFVAQCVLAARAGLFYCARKGHPSDDSYYASAAHGRNPLRWVEYALSASTMMVLLAYFMGVVQWPSLLALFGLLATTQLFGLVSEEWNALLLAHAPRASRWRRAWPHLCGWVPLLFAWSVAWVAFGRASDDSGGNMPGFVIVIVSVQCVLFLAFGLVQFSTVLAPPSTGCFLTAEAAYAVLSLTSKTLLAWMVYWLVD